MNKTLIENDKLTPKMERVRSGSTQLFRRKGLDNKFTEESNADVVLEPPRPELYAELIEGQWYWVNGCAECNGKPRDWMTYVECEKHNVCRTCGVSRQQLKGAVMGGRNGWQCRPCHITEAEINKKAALQAV